MEGKEKLAGELRTKNLNESSVKDNEREQATAIQLVYNCISENMRTSNTTGTEQDGFTYLEIYMYIYVYNKKRKP